MSLLVTLFGTPESDAACPETDARFDLHTIGGDAYCTECHERLSVTRRAFRRPQVRH